MGKSAPKQQVTEYRMSVHIGVALTLDAITGIYVNEKEAWTGRSTTPEALLVNKPDLFGGVQREGGLIGYVWHLPGKADQVLPEALAARFGLTSETCPAFRGLTSLFFVGGGPVVTGSTRPGVGLELLDIIFDEELIQEQNTVGNGFSWSYNNPVIAQTVWVRGERAPKTVLNPAWAMIGQDANPAHIIAECLTDTDFGMGDSPSMLNVPVFNAVAQTLYDEEFGLSFAWTQQTKIEDLVSEILDHIQATLFLNPQNGLWEIKLLRDDYDVGSLRHINPQNAKLTNFQRKMWGEVANEVSVTWTNPENEQEESVSWQDLGAVLNQGGSPITTSRNYYAVRNRSLALRLAQRDVRTTAAPLATATAEVTREFWDVKPGEVFLLTWPEKKVFNLVVRALQPDMGTPENGTIKLSLLEDIFSLERPPVGQPQEPGWIDPSDVPSPMDATEIITLPAYFAASADLQTAAVDLEYPEVLAAVLGYKESADALAYSLASEDVTSGGQLAWRAHGLKNVVERTVLPFGLAYGAESRLSQALVINPSRGPKVGGFVFFGSGSDAAMEIAHVTAYDEETEEWVISRGVLDTVPRAWPAGTPAWFVNPGQNLVDEIELRSAGEAVAYKLLTRTSKGGLPLADAPLVTETLSARPHLPLRPANVKVNGTASGSLAGGAVETLTVTWSTRNRQFEDGQVIRWDAGPVAPEYEQGTVVTVFDQDGNNVYEQWGLWTENELALPRSWFDRYSAVTIQVSSRRREFDSLQGHSIQVTGLPANPAAPLPPAPPEPGPPPSPEPAPAEGAWSATGIEFVLDGTGEIVAKVPGLVVSGTRDRPTAIGLNVRYRKDGTTDWFYLSELALTDQPTKIATTAIAPQTTYIVEVAYRTAGNILSHWRNLGPVTTGQAIAQDTLKIGGKDAAEAVEAIEAIAEVGEGSIARARTRFAQLRSGNTNNAVSAFHAAADLAARRELTEFRTMVGEEWVGTYAERRTTELFNENEARLQEIEVLGVSLDDAHADILNAMTIAATADEAIVELVTQAQAEIDNNYAAFLDEVDLNTTRFAAQATQINSLITEVDDNYAAFLSEQSLNTTRHNSQATAITALNTEVDGNWSAFVSEQSLNSSRHSSQASLITALQVDVGGLEGSITVHASAIADLEDGLDLVYGFALNANGHVVGVRAANDGTIGTIWFVFDSFGFVKPGGTDPKYILAYTGSELYLVNTRVNGNLLVEGTITTNRIVANNIAEKVIHTLPAAVNLTTSNQFIMSGGMTTSAGKVEVDLNIGINMSGNSIGQLYDLYCDGSLIESFDDYAFEGLINQKQGTKFTHNPGAGFHTYALYGRKQSGGGTPILHKCILTITDNKTTT